MDLTVEKEALLVMIGVPTPEIPTYHFHGCPDNAALAAVERGLAGPLTPRMRANVRAIRYIARNTDLLPVGMCIGPFSLMTKLIADPITPVFLAGSGTTGEEDEEVRAMETALELAERVILWSLDAQIEAGAKAIIVCEPAANSLYFSPRQLASGSDVFERYAMVPNRRIRARLEAAGVDLIFHDCGELTDGMVEQFATLAPAVLSLGSSRTLWEDAARVPKQIVLYGNLPTRRFYSDEITVTEVEQLAREITHRMREADHPFILGSECDVLSVPQRHHIILEKVQAFLRCDCGG
jgi:uroporphyrinogen-III decarboxylase